MDDVRKFQNLVEFRKPAKMPAEKYLNVKTIIPTNPSSQALVKSHGGQLRPNDSEESIEIKTKVKSPNFVSRSDWMTLAILTFVNLINYMDRYTIAGKFYFCRFSLF